MVLWGAWTHLHQTWPGHGAIIPTLPRKLHTVFWLVPTLVTLNDLEQSNIPYFALFHRIW